MKYNRLTKEQFEELQQEFINFLSAQTITADEWAMIKETKPEVAEQELDVFSDLVWERVLTKAKYLERISAQHMYLFQLDDDKIKLIGLNLKDASIDLTTKPGFEWLRSNILNDDVELFQANKNYSEDKLLDRFQLIQQGAVITKGELFMYFEKLLG